MKTNILIISVLMIAVLVSSACTTNRSYDSPEPLETPEYEDTTTSPPAIETFNIGETAPNGELSITINSIRYSEEIDEQGNEFLVAVAKEGKKYVIIDLTIENLQNDKTHPISSILQFQLTDDEGYSYDLDFMALTSLDKGFKGDGDLLPGMKTRGEVPFEVPEDVTGLKFMFLFEIGGTTAVYEL